MTRLLALDTATLFASVAALEGERVVATRSERVTTHSDRLLTLVAETLGEAGWTPRDIEAVACGAGPGSFTGLRIGLATAKGLCLAHQRPLVLVSSLAALAARGRGATLAVLDAHKGELYAGEFFVDENGVPTPTDDEETIAPAALRARLEARGGAPLAVVGDGLLRAPELLSVPGVTRVDDMPAPQATDVGRLAAQRLARGESDPLVEAAPRYIRPSEAELMKARKAESGEDPR
jgi:tRNA threonylcarbamoyladenosine biosynthesis protein TsaB